MRKALIGLVFLSVAFMAGCGQDAALVSENPPAEDTGATDPGTDPGTAPVDGGTKISYQKMQGYLNIYCNSCHASDKFMRTEKDLRASSVKVRIANGSMPTPGAKPLPSNIKTEMLGFF